MQVLVIEAEQGASGHLAARLDKSGFSASRTVSVRDQFASKALTPAAALVLDLGLDERSAIELTSGLRNVGYEQPLIVLSARGDWRDKVDVLDAGADDYLCKPVRSEEIAARLFALIRRSSGKVSSRFRVGDIELDLRARCAWRDGECLNLTRNEFRLLCLFMLGADRTMSQREIQDNLYPDPGKRSVNALEVLIARLRRKVGHERIVTVRGIGYRFSPAAGRQSPRSSAGKPCKAAADRSCAFPQKHSACRPSEQRNEACFSYFV